MIGPLSRAVAADLRTRKFPHPVSYGPERFARGGFDMAIIFERDRQAGDAIGAAIGANQRNPESPFVRAVAGAVTVFARSPKPGATAEDHEEECDRVCDGVLTALYRILKERKLPLAIVESRLLARADLAEGSEGDDVSGTRSADWPGCAARIRFTVGTLVRDVTYPGAAQDTAEVAAVDPPTVVVGYAPPEDP